MARGFRTEGSTDSPRAPTRGGVCVRGGVMLRQFANTYIHIFLKMTDSRVTYARALETPFLCCYPVL